VSQFSVEEVPMQPRTRITVLLTGLHILGGRQAAHCHYRVTNLYISGEQADWLHRELQATTI